MLADTPSYVLVLQTLMLNKCRSLYYVLDPCERITCDGTNAVCEIVFDTGKPFCTCGKGFTGDPTDRCGNK